MSLKLIPKLVWDKHLESAYKVHIQHVTYNKYDIELLCLAHTHTHTHKYMSEKNNRIAIKIYDLWKKLYFFSHTICSQSMCMYF